MSAVIESHRMFGSADQQTSRGSSKVIKLIATTQRWIISCNLTDLRSEVI